MKVLVVHNFYVSASPSGENRVVENEVDQLQSAGVDVVRYFRSSDEIARMGKGRRVGLAMSPIVSPSAVRDVKGLLNREQPDILHLHNPYPLISPAVIRVAKANGVPVVQTCHNHRHTCMKGTFERNGALCHDCQGLDVPWPGVVHACYRGSRVQSTVMAATLSAHRGTWELVDRFIALTPEIADSLRARGVTDDRIVLKPNSVPDPGSDGLESGSGFVYVGRLTRDKGVPLLLEAWTRHPEGSLGTLTFVGEGPEASAVAAAAAVRHDLNYLGRLPAPGVTQAMRSARAVLVPSVWPEAMPLTVLEAFATGRAVLASDVGGLPRIVTPDVGLVIPTTADAWSTALHEAANEIPLEALGRNARALFESEYHPHSVLKRLVAIYEDVAVARGPRANRRERSL